MSAHPQEGHVEVRLTPHTRNVIQRAADEVGVTVAEFAEESLALAAQRVLADRRIFALNARSTAQWEGMNAGPARDLPGLRRLLAQRSPFPG